MRLRGLFTVIGVATAAWLGTACSSDTSEDQAELDTIVITTQSWKATEFNANVAKILIEQKLSKKVTLKFIDEYEQWPELASGTVHASLENWPSGHQDDLTTYVNSGQVENLGALGAQAKIGWYVPTYMTVADASLSKVASYADAVKAAQFKTAETGDLGRILVGDTTWVSHEEAIIKNLGLKLKVAYAGGEENLLAELDTAYNNRNPILMQLWIPNAALTKYDMTEVELAPYSEACYSDPAKINCDYPPDLLFKATWPQLKTRAPRVHKLFKSMQLTTKNQVDFLRETVKGTSSEAAAQQWVTANEAIWAPWVAP